MSFYARRNAGNLNNDTLKLHARINAGVKKEFNHES